MRYLILHPMEDEPRQTDHLPDDAAQQVIDGDFEVFRFENGKFEQLTPIDEDDLDNWSTVTEDR